MVEIIKKVMVVEDDPADHDMLRDYLEAQAFEVISVRDARNIFEMVGNEKPELIFMALMLNDFIRGEELVEKLKSEPEFNTPVVGMSAQVNTDAAYFYSICDYQLAKPITIGNIRDITSKVFS
jgi:two-component system sensor histidine kinase ChiS